MPHFLVPSVFEDFGAAFESSPGLDGVSKKACH